MTNELGSPDDQDSDFTEIIQTTSIDILPIFTTGGSLNGSDVLSSTNPLLEDSSSAAAAACSSSNATSTTSAAIDPQDRLRFHSRCGSLVKLSNGNRTGERRRPLDEFNNGVVMTHRPLRDNELFEIRIDTLVDKWSGSIEVGVTTHNPNALHFPATMTNMRSGTIMMSGCGILTNGKGTRREYGEFNLDELREGDRVGMMKKSNGNLHYYINGRDQGIAATRVAQTLFGVIDLYGMTIKVTIVDPDERELMNLVTRRTIGHSGVATVPPVVVPKPAYSDASAALTSDDSTGQPSLSSHRLTFHNICGSHACVTHSGRTALRPCASEDFNNGVVLTRRPLRPNELFQVRLECVVTKWAGSIEIGVTTHSPTELQFPFTMTNVRSGTWMMTGNGVMHNGITVLEQYGQNLDRLQVGDRVGVVRKDDGTLHFWVNGVDQGPAATNVPDRVYGVIDLYGQAAQASIVDTSEVCSPDTGNSTISNTTLYGSESRLKFHQSVHGRNARVTNNGQTAHRQKAVESFDDAILFSNRPLRQREMFEVGLDMVTSHWKDSISIGVTGVRPEEISLPRTATGLHQEAILVSGNSLLLNGVTIRKDFLPFHLDSLSVGTRLGVQLNGDFVHFYVDGVDFGPAYECKVQTVYAVVDLYGQCSKVNILPMGMAGQGGPGGDCSISRAPYATSENSQSIQAASVINPGGLTIGTRHRFSHVTSGDVSLTDNQTVAVTQGEAWSQGLAFSSNVLEVGEHMEIRVTRMNLKNAGCLKVGVTDLNLNDCRLTKNLPSLVRQLPGNNYFVSGDGVWFNKTLLNRALASLEWLRSGDTLTIELTSSRTVRMLINGEDMNVQFTNVDSRDLYLVVELQGATTGVEIVSTVGPSSPLRPCSLRLQDSLEYVLDPLGSRQQQDSMLESIDSDFFTFEFAHDFHGENVKIGDDRKMGQRVKAYNYGCIGIPKPLCKGHSICIKVEEVNPKWKGTLAIGAIGVAPHHINFNALSSSLLLKRPCWIVTHDYVNVNGHKTRSNYGEVLDRIQRGTIVTMMLTHSGNLVLMVDKTNLEVFATGLPNHVYPVFDLYGKCERITILNVEVRNGTPVNHEELPEEIIGEELEMMEGLGGQNDNERDREEGESNYAMRQCEKADLEVHEKEEQEDSMMALMMLNYNNNNNSNNTSGPGAGPSTSTADDTRIRNRMSENYWTNMNIKSRSKNELSNSTSLRDSLELHHSTNLNIQRSQSQQRFDSNCGTTGGSASAVYPEPGGAVAGGGQVAVPGEGVGMSHSCHDSNYYLDDGNRMFTEGNYLPSMSALESEIESLLLAEGSEGRNDDGGLSEGGGAEGGGGAGGGGTRRGTAEGAERPEGEAFDERESTERSTTIEAATDSLPSGASNSSLIMDLESIHCSVAGETVQRDTCEVYKLICGFKRTLVLPEEFFAHEIPVCFCASCSVNLVKGSRHQQLAQMLSGWVRFRLNEETTNAGNIVLDSDEKTLAFYATTVDRIRSILDNGQLLPVATGSGQKDDGGGGVQLVLSASPNDNLRLHQHFNFRSHSYQIGTAFEVHVRTQSLCTSDEDAAAAGGGHGTSSVGTSSSSSSSTVTNATGNSLPPVPTPPVASASGSGSSTLQSIGNQRNLWTTKEAGACVLTALLLRLELVN